MTNVNPSLRSLLVDVARLRADDKNARFHDERSIESIEHSLRKFGQQKPVVALRDGKVIAGNGTLAAAKKLGWPQLAVVWFDDEKLARAYAVADNRTAELSVWDQEQLATTLTLIRDQDQVALDVVGFNAVEFAQLSAATQPPTPPQNEWDGMPEFDQQDKTAERQIVMNFRSQEDVEAFGALIGQNVSEKTRSLWYPKAEIDRLMDKRYKSTKASDE